MTAHTATVDPVSRPSFLSTLQAFGMLPILILLGLVFQFFSGLQQAGSVATAFTDGRFVSLQNLSIVAAQASINTVLAAGMTFVILTGGIDLSVGSILAASAMLGLIVSLLPNYSFLGFETCLLTGLVLGLANGALIAFLRLPPFIVTLGSLTAVRGIARLFSSDRTVFNPALGFAFIGNQTFYGIPLLTVIAFAVIVLSWFILKRTVLGVRIYALGGNGDAARLAGIKVPLVLMFVYGMSGLLAGLGGAMSAARLFAANGVQLGQSYELDAIAAVILGGTSFVGGTGSIWGTLVGALIIAVLSNGLILTGVSDIWQYIIKGLVIIGAVALDRYRLAKTARS
jgi:ribose transport system permease protein